MLHHMLNYHGYVSSPPTETEPGIPLASSIASHGMTSGDGNQGRGNSLKWTQY